MALYQAVSASDRPSVVGPPILSAWATGKAVRGDFWPQTMDDDDADPLGNGPSRSADLVPAVLNGGKSRDTSCMARRPNSGPVFVVMDGPAAA